MRKVLYFATALTVAMTSFSSVASAAALRAYGVNDEDSAAVTLDIKTKWDSDTSYTDHPESAPKELSQGTSVKFDSEATLDMTEVAKKWHEFVTSTPYASGYIERNGYDALVSAVTLTGSYTLVIDADSVISNNGKDTVLDWADNEAGYNVKTYFEQDGDAVYDEAANTLTVTMKVKDNANADLDTYFTALYNESQAADGDTSKYDFVLDIADSTIDVSNAGTYNVKGTFSGYVDIKLGNRLVSKVTFAETTDAEYMHVPNASTPTATPTATPYVSHRGGGGGGGSRPTATPSVTTPTETPTGTPGEDVTPSPVPEDRIQNVTNSRGASLNKDDHYAYIIGYPLEEDETLAEVRPQASITRAEVATIFFRLLTDESRTKFWTTDNSFSDVDKAEWYNNAISTAQNAGIIEGSNGLFRPNDAITRAEFAAIAARFSSVAYDGDDKFTDISGHWAKDSINKAAETGWIQGYDDKTFRPDNKITRAEAMTLVNRMLYRIVAVSGLEEDGMLTWVDNLDKSAWYYPAVQEATNSHDYSRAALGYSEDWTRTKAPRDWEALEKTYSQPTSAGTEDSVYEDSDYEELNTEQEAVDKAETADEETAEESTEAESTEAESTETEAAETEASEETAEK